MTFRFLGAESLVGDSIRLNRFGQAVELAEPQAVNATPSARASAQASSSHRAPCLI